MVFVMTFNLELKTNGQLRAEKMLLLQQFLAIILSLQSGLAEQIRKNNNEL